MKAIYRYNVYLAHLRQMSKEFPNFLLTLSLGRQKRQSQRADEC